MPSGNEFVQKLVAAMASHDGLDEDEYVELWRMYDEMGNLAKYGLSSRLTLEYAELDQSLRASDPAAGWQLYNALGGPVE